MKSLDFPVNYDPEEAFSIAEIALTEHFLLGDGWYFRVSRVVQLMN